jgi:tetratricopeptide (TPR) repeat protein
MTQLLSLTDRLITRADSHLSAGNYSQALSLLQQVLRLAELPAATLQATHEAMAEAHHGLKNLRRARRHLHAARALAPESAHLHCRLGQLHEEDEQHGDLDRAVKHYRKAVELSPDEAEYHHALGRALFQTGKKKRGLTELAKAVEMAPDSVEYLREQALRLVDAGRVTLARRLVRAARFQHHDASEFAQLWREVGFRIAQCHQSRRRTEAARDILPFRRPVAARIEREDGVILRIDRPSQAQPHLPRSRRTWQTNER